MIFARKGNSVHSVYVNMVFSFWLWIIGRYSQEKGFRIVDTPIGRLGTMGKILNSCWIKWGGE